MVVSDIVSGVNAKLAGETLTYNQLRLFLDETIDDINAELNAKFPIFTGLGDGEDYNFFPDKYIRSVVITGAAHKFYVTDEEGIMTAQQYAYDYADRLFTMKRDYTCKVPLEYREDAQGFVEMDTGPRLSTNLRGW